MATESRERAATDTVGMMSFGARLRQLAAERGDRTVLTILQAAGTSQDVSWAELNRLVDRLAHVIANRVAGKHTVVGIGLHNGLAHIATVLACWRAGCTTVVFDPSTPLDQATVLFDRAGAVLAVIEDQAAAGQERIIDRATLWAAAQTALDSPFEDRVPRPGKIMMSGGSTGLPKLMADDLPWISAPGAAWGNVARTLGFRPNQVQLVCGAMSHNAPLTWAQLGLFEGHHLIVMERFDALRALRAIDDYGVQFVMVVPTMMARMLDALKQADIKFTTLEAFYHTAAVCSIWLKQAWIDRLGAGRVFEMYGSGENVGQTIITGEEWLAHPGSVGRPFETDARVLDPDGKRLPAGEVGELFMKRWSTAGGTRYLDPGHVARSDPDGFICVGDLAWLDADGYVHLAGRRDDTINSGGIKIHPEKVEAALLSHPAVRDVVVVGLSDREWGQRIHAVVELRDGVESITLEELRQHGRTQLAPTELPKSMTILDRLPRDGFGKVRRRTIRENYEQHVCTRRPLKGCGSRSTRA